MTSKKTPKLWNYGKLMSNETSNQNFQSHWEKKQPLRGIFSTEHTSQLSNLIQWRFSRGLEKINNFFICAIFNFAHTYKYKTYIVCLYSVLLSRVVLNLFIHRNSRSNFSFQPMQRTRECRVYFFFLFHFVNWWDIV